MGSEDLTSYYSKQIDGGKGGMIRIGWVWNENENNFKRENGNDELSEL